MQRLYRETPMGEIRASRLAISRFLHGKVNKAMEHLDEFRDSDGYDLILDSVRLVLLEPDDNLHDLSEAGFTGRNRNLFVSLIEDIEEFRIGKSLVYEFAVLESHELMIHLYIEKGMFNDRFPELDDLIREYGTITGER